MKTLITIIFLFVLSTTTYSQVSIGIRAGITGSDISKYKLISDRITPLVGFSGGGFVNFKICKNFSFQPEVLFSMRGYTYNSNYLNTKSRIRLNYLDIPVLFKLSFGEKISPFLNLGVSPSFFLSGTRKANSFDLGIVVSPGIQITLNDNLKTFFEVRGYLGTIGAYGSSNTINRSISLYTGLVF